MWLFVSGWIAWAVIAAWPWRREWKFSHQCHITAAPERIWSAHCIDPDRTEVVPFQANVIVARRVQDEPEIIECVTDTSGGYRTHSTTVRMRTLEKRPYECWAFHTCTFDGRDAPHGPAHMLAFELRPESGATATTLSWRGETATLGQYLRLRLWYARYLQNLKRYAETGTVAGRRWPSRALAISVVAFASFVVWLGWTTACLLAAALIVHESGHWLAMRLTGQPAPRMMLVPFFGGVTLATHPHKTLFNDAFCALMGAGFSAIPCLASLALAWHLGLPHDGGTGALVDATGPVWRWSALLAFVLGLLNLFQLLPFLPLDGGQVLRALMQSFHAVWVLGMVGFGYLGDLIVAGIFGVGILQAWHLSKERPRAEPMRISGLVAIGSGAIATIGIHAAAVAYWISKFGIWLPH
jgi:Zn-dependent protease